MIFLSLLAFAAPLRAANTWKNVRIGGGGGFVPGIIFHPTEPGVAYARSDIGGLYRLNPDDSWAAVTDSITDNENWCVGPNTMSGTQLRRKTGIIGVSMPWH